MYRITNYLINDIFFIDICENESNQLFKYLFPIILNNYYIHDFICADLYNQIICELSNFTSLQKQNPYNFTFKDFQITYVEESEIGDRFISLNDEAVYFLCDVLFYNYSQNPFITIDETILNKHGISMLEYASYLVTKNF